jgi:hypothetical protein
MNGLYERAIAHYGEHFGASWLVRQSMPILYFGDLSAYRSSPRRIVTAALNPSLAEFADTRFLMPEPLTAAALEPALSAYFTLRPYSGWFDPAFETLLQPLGASFYGSRYPGNAPKWWRPQANQALHTDLCSPLATNPVWSRLDEAVRTQLREVGSSLWRDLIAALDPDLILVSVARGHLDAIGATDWREVLPFAGARVQQRLLVGRLGGATIVWGQAGRKPFAQLSRPERQEAAATIASTLHR